MWRSSNNGLGKEGGGESQGEGGGVGAEREEDGMRAEWVEGGEVGGDGCAMASCEGEAMFEIGPGAKPSEFPCRSNHSTLHAQGKDNGGRLGCSREG
jgi:hypothetical protein